MDLSRPAVVFAVSLSIACGGDDGSAAEATASAGSTHGGETGGSSGTGMGTTAGESDGASSGGAAGVCEGYVANQVMCDRTLAGMEAPLLAECESQRVLESEVYGEACAALLDAFYACAAGQPCEAGEACAAEEAAVVGCAPAIGAVCAAYGAKFVECGMGDGAEDAAMCQVAINSGAFYGGAECGGAYEGYFACASGLGCGDFEAGIGCEDGLVMVEMVCML